MSMAPGTRFGSYEVAALVGVGGMGEVYRAHDPSLKRDVALKVLPDELVTDANRLARLQREAEVLASLSHGNVAQIYGLERSGGRMALVMELVDGVTLAERIGQGRLPPSEALAVATQIAAALEAAHEQGIVHRDLKPANIKLKPDGTVKVLDFGIAKALDLRATSGPRPPALTTPAMTEAGLVLGTAAYMSPEQARGKPVDKRADIWAFGCVLYEMLTGKPAFLGDDMTTTLARVLEREPDLKPLPAGLAPAVRRTLELCLQKDVKKRLSDIRDVRLALDGELAEPAAPARPLWRRALPVAAALVAGALIAGAYVAGVVEPAPTPVSAVAPLPVMRFLITPPATAPLASSGGLDLAISPDGKRLAYLAQGQDGELTLQVRELDGLETRPIPGTTMAALGAVNPFFSTDGKSIGFSSGARGVIRASVDGVPALKMLDAPAPNFLGATWAADDTLIYSSGRRLWRASAGGGGTPEPLLPEGPLGEVLVNPQLLPGGRGVLYASIVDGVDRIEVLDLETRERKTLIEGGGHATYAATGHVVFARGTTLMAAPFDPAELALTGGPVAMLQDVRHPNPQTAADYTLSATGTLAYVPADAGAGDGRVIVWVDRSGAVAGRAVSEVVDNARDPRLSPDGQRLVLTTGPPGDGDLWSYDLRGRPPLRLAVANDNRAAVWSPDGRQIAFLSISAQTGIFTLPADGSALERQSLPTAGIVGQPQAWTAAGDLLFSPAPPDLSIRRVSIAAAGEARDVVATDYAEFDAALSPDGRWLAYVSDRSGANEIWVQGYPDGVAVRVSQNGGFEPRWSADGRELYYLQFNALMAVAVESEREFVFAAPVRLFGAVQFFFFPGPVVRTYDVAPDGRFLMIQSEAATQPDPAPPSIVVVQNWFEELRQRVPARN
jgi:eukaryotic-like serine/threonine-protein kinase